MTLQLAGLNRILSDVDTIGEVAERPALPRFVRKLLTIGNELKGLDRQRPLTLEVFLAEEDGPPEVRVCIPLTEIADFRETTRRLQWDWTSVDETNFEVQRPRGSRPIYVRTQDDWVFLSESPALLKFDVSKAAQVEANSLSDVTFRLRSGNIPAARVQHLLDIIQKSVLRERESTSGEENSVQGLRAEAIALAEQVLMLVINETDTFELRIDVATDEPGQTRSGIRIQQDWQVKPDGELADQLPKLAVSSPLFPLATTQGAAFRGHFAVQLPTSVRQLAARTVELGRDAARHEVARLDETTQQTLLGMFDSFAATVESGHVEGCVEFLPTESQRMVLLSGWKLNQGDKLAAALPLLLPEVRKSGDVDTVNLNFGQIGGTSFHQLQDDKERRVDEHLYGGRAAVYVGASRDALWAVMGGDRSLEVSTPRVEERNEAINSTGLLATFEWHLRPWLTIFQATSRKGRLVATIQSVFADESSDGIAGEVRIHGTGISSRMTVDFPFLNALGKLVSNSP